LGEYKNNRPMLNHSVLAERGPTATYKTKACQHLYDIIRHSNFLIMSWPNADRVWVGGHEYDGLTCRDVKKQ
jgi:hypothetical protein